MHQVNPAFSAIIERVKFMERYALDVHQPGSGPGAGPLPAQLFEAHPQTGSGRRVGRGSRGDLSGDRFGAPGRSRLEPLGDGAA